MASKLSAITTSCAGWGKDSSWLDESRTLATYLCSPGLAEKVATMVRPARSRGLSLAGPGWLGGKSTTTTSLVTRPMAVSLPDFSSRTSSAKKNRQGTLPAPVTLRTSSGAAGRAAANGRGVPGFAGRARGLALALWTGAGGALLFFPVVVIGISTSSESTDWQEDRRPLQTFAHHLQLQ